MHKAQAYAILRNLQRKGIIEATLEAPTRFSSVPVEKLLDDFIEAKRREAISLEKEKDTILAQWQHIRPPDLESHQERFVILQGKERIRSKLFDMINSAKKEIQIAMTALEIVRANNWFILERLTERLAEQHPINLRVMTSISGENANLVKRFVKLDTGRKLADQWRHAEIDSIDIPSILTKDREETCILTPPDVDGHNLTHTALWTNSRPITRINLSFLEQLWRSATRADQKLHEIEAPSILSTSITIADPKIAYRRLIDTVRKATQEVTHVIPSRDVLDHKQTRSLWQIPHKGVIVRVMCPAESVIGKSMQRLSRIAEIRDPNISYLAVSLIDRQHLFRFNAPPSTKAEFSVESYFGNTFYTNDPVQIRTMSQMIEGLWNRSEQVMGARP